MNDNNLRPGLLLQVDDAGPPQFTLGDFAQDRTTGLVGLLYGRTELLHGELRFGVLPINSVAVEHGGHGTNTHRALEWIDARSLRPVPENLQKVIDKRRRDHLEQQLQEIHAAAGGED